MRHPASPTPSPWSILRAPSLTLFLGILGAQAGPALPGEAAPRNKTVLHAFDQEGVRLLPSRWQAQVAEAREFYMGLSDDDVLHGFRKAAGLPAPGKPLGGWAEEDSSVVFGQWLQAMARMSHATGDEAMRRKASLWVREWGKAFRAKAPQLQHYPFEKLAGGLLDMARYAGDPEALDLLEQLTRLAQRTLDRSRIPANRRPWELHSGSPLEWYTLGEHLYRAFEQTGNELYKDFADVWRYPAYWDKFADTPRPGDATGVHAYSHVNSFSSAAMAYDVTGDEKYLRILRNAYDFLQGTQVFATGGYGPAERLLPADGALGEALEQRIDSCEVPCCGWAGFKLAKYLMLYTGEARYGDWIERLLYNGIGAALPVSGNGRHFYYASYHLGAAQKTVSRSTFTCCTGTYFQSMAELADLIYFRDPAALSVNLYVPSEVDVAGGTFSLTTAYPEAETVRLRCAKVPAPGTPFTVRLRVPSWSQGMTVALNGKPLDVAGEPGTWARVARTWQAGDEVRITIPLHFRRVPVDKEHPDRVALVRGPLVYAQEVIHKAMSTIPGTDAELDRLMVPYKDDPALFRLANEEEVEQRDAFLPFYRFPEVKTYRMYFDPKNRRALW